MPTDLTGGIDPSREYVFAERPDNPDMRDSVGFWITATAAHAKVATSSW